MNQSAQHFAIVGGGTAGWLVALILSDAAKRSVRPLRITMVESSKIPTIGVGEGSTAVLRAVLGQLGIDELEFIRETEATIKFGIRHKDWRRIGHCYDGPIDDPHQVCPAPEGVTSSWLNQYCVASGRPVQEPHLFSYLLAKDKAPFARMADGSLIPVGPFHYAYHFDQSLVAKFLRKKAVGIDLLDAKMTGADRDAGTGDITRLHFEDADDLDVDFVFDCTGFRRQIIGQLLGADWVSYSDQLPVNRAMPFWIDIREDEEIGPYTLAWAQTAGWMWKIPTATRYGCGYVYSDHHLTPDQAKAEIEAKLGHSIEPRNDIKISSGRLDRVWINNCIAMGLSSSFLEPLEATSIHGTIVQILAFLQFHLDAPANETSAHRDTYNETVARQVDDFMYFINLHYMTERTDSAFWNDVRQNYVLEHTRGRLDTWADHMPRREDFAPFPGNLPHIEEQLYYPVLDGLGLLDRTIAKREMDANPKLRAHARATNESLSKEYRSAAGRALGHREFLKGLVA